MHLRTLDITVFVLYFAFVMIFAMLIAARSKTKSASDYFFASKKLPWYVVGASFIAANISTEHFIGMVGWGYLYGMAVANWEWGNAITFSALIWIFLPFYMRGNVSTMPEFLEKRFNRICRHIYAIVMIIGLVIAMLGGVLLAGAKAMHVFFPSLSTEAAILILAIAAGTYTIYGGLLSAVWADLLQYILLMVGGAVVTIYGLFHADGLSNLMAELPEKFIMLYPATHENIPWTGVVSMLFSVGIWYSCANQTMVQRCLGAKSEWDARMGVVMAGFSKAILPFLVVIPGIVAFYLYHDYISDADTSWPIMVCQFLPDGLAGLVLAGLASAILSTLSAITHSSSTIFTLDLYQSIFRPNATDRQLHRTGRISAVVILLAGITIALILSQFPRLTIFGIIQTTFFYMAPPIAAIFLIGILWWRITSTAATATLLLGFLVYLPLTKWVIFPLIPAFTPYDSFMHHTFVIFCLSVVTLVVISLFTRPRDRASLKGVIWSLSALHVEQGKGRQRKGLQSLGLWWVLMMMLIGGLYFFMNSRGNVADQIEAEEVELTCAEGATVQIDPRGTYENFTLWTGEGQLKFTPQKTGDWIEFVLPVQQPGTYEVAMLVTKGTGYGRFSAQGPAGGLDIRYAITKSSSEAKLDIQWQKTLVFDSSHINSDLETMPTNGQYRVQRVSLGAVVVEGDSFKLRIVSDGDQAPGAIGIDHFILVKHP